MQEIRLTEDTPALIEVPFTSVLDSDLQSRILAATLANTAISVYSKRAGIANAVALTSDGTTWTACDDTNAPGVRGYLPKADELVLGVQTLIFTGTNMEPREVPINVTRVGAHDPGYYGLVVAGTLTTSAFTTDREETTVDAWKDALIEFQTGPCAGSVKPIGRYTGNGSVGTFTLKTGYTLPAAPTEGDLFRIITR